MNIKRNIFREYDIRGIYPEDLNEATIRLIAGSVASKCHAEGVDSIAVGRDGRLSGESLLSEFCNEIIKYGIKVINIGLVTSPLLYYAAKKTSGKSGVMITGSHNPKDYNGLKLVINDKPVAGTEILDLINSINKDDYIDAEIEHIDFINQYVSEVSESLDIDKNLKVVIDCGNGAAGAVAPLLFKKIGVRLSELFSEVDGNFPNHHPDPSKPENLKDLVNKVLEENADIGFAFDGDGDRVGVVTKLGKDIFADKLLMLLAENVLENKQGAVVYDVKCSNHLHKTIEVNNGNAIMAPTGHFHIKNAIKKHSAVLAGEMSGHIFFNDKWYGFDDGHYTAARVLEIMTHKNSDIDSLINMYPKTASTPELNIKVADDKKFDVVSEFIDKANINGEKISIDGIRINMENGWGLLRASNTSPNLVLRFEGDTEEDLIQIKSMFLNEFSRIFPDIDLN
jgi:phosphomannomutase/phosphoglucomutase